MSVHTPGPWKYRNDVEMIVSDHPDWNESCICKIASGEAAEHDAPNARAIAAVPDMIEALRWVREDYTALARGDSEPITGAADTLSRINALLVKAGVAQ